MDGKCIQIKLPSSLWFCCYHFFLRFVLLLLKFQTFCFALRLINISPRSCVRLIVKATAKKNTHNNFLFVFLSFNLCGCVFPSVLYSQYIPHLIFSSFLHLLLFSAFAAVAASLFCFCRSAVFFIIVVVAVVVHEFTLSVLCAIPIQFRS